MTEALEPKLPVVGIMRHRMFTDGEGVTTLVGAKGCPLKCKYCINEDALKASASFKFMTVSELIEALKPDDLYFKATYGGVVFGGGESLMHIDFIKAFREAAPKEWKIMLETSLNAPTERFMQVRDIVDEYLVDIKDMNPVIYKSYTGLDNAVVKKNLKLLAEVSGSKRITIRIPLIPKFNTDEDRGRSEAEIRAISDRFLIDRFEYVIR